jgi:hypothetical protein
VIRNGTAPLFTALNLLDDVAQSSRKDTVKVAVAPGDECAIER